VLFRHAAARAGTVQARPWVPGAAAVVTAREPMPSVIDPYKGFDLRHPGWIKVALIASREGGVG
jgi:hypothetical protein